MERILIIVRGLPGSGKNSFAELLNAHICTADDYFMNGNKYEWKPENISKAHFLCRQKCELLMKNNIERIAIANTSTTEKELKPYYDLALKYDYRIFSIIMENRISTKNIHNVSEETIENMRKRFSIKL